MIYIWVRVYKIIIEFRLVPSIVKSYKVNRSIALRYNEAFYAWTQDNEFVECSIALWFQGKFIADDSKTIESFIRGCAVCPMSFSCRSIPDAISKAESWPVIGPLCNSNPSKQFTHSSVYPNDQLDRRYIRTRSYGGRGVWAMDDGWWWREGAINFIILRLILWVFYSFTIESK